MQKDLLTVFLLELRIHHSITRTFWVSLILLLASLRSSLQYCNHSSYFVKTNINSNALTIKYVVYMQHESQQQYLHKKYRALLKNLFDLAI